MSATLSRGEWRQAGLLTLGAVALLLGLRFFRTRPALTHMDFVSGGPAALQFCQAGNPRFLPVVARSSPVAMTLRTGSALAAWMPAEPFLSLQTNTGKPIGPRDLVLTGGAKLNLLIVDPDLGDFQAVQPTPGARPGEWRFLFTPHRGGLYRIFADFTPAATGQEMYASADLAVEGAPGPDLAASRLPATGRFERDGLRMTLRPSVDPVPARTPVELVFTVARLDGDAVELQPVAGALARLVAFDRDRTGFVNLSPEPGGISTADEKEPRLAFRVTIPDPGHYVVWSRLVERNTEVVAPFALEVTP